MTLQDDPPVESEPYKNRYLTIPNVICGFRIVGSLALLGLAISGRPTAFVVLFVVLHMSDWIDGRLARWLHQRSDFGARLDSLSDAILYGCLIIGCLLLKWEVLQKEAIWLAVPLICYAITVGYGLWKYGRVPSYHTQFAKWGNWLVLAAAVALLLDWSLWPLRIAAIGGTVTNLETIAMTYVLPNWTADVLSLRAALRLRSAQRQGSPVPADSPQE
ncbi:CDP-alcohol phosphatidyltransferase family protein [Fuerstiella marisgermanici]|uniref:Phosphatidylglycerophosphate synthetase n=1 Tax=Fuerstiella marisgermanici TaxID=1891926 RepID=A0A1P8WBB3_9PLAN|nr:CDP-alcohol phosphatidyltransferase family protein [Fuerstiella marisgermanici]APZ91326.1 phosphatidylglycerophosphate synthetase [Fuerstiella marisgermanici]